MKIIDIRHLSEDRVVKCPRGGFVSNRILLASDGMGYTLCNTYVPVGTWQRWCYKKHLESCYCVSGQGILKDLETGETHQIGPGVTYVLDKHDDHEFMSITDVTLICVFNPPLKGREVHKDDNSYE